MDETRISLTGGYFITIDAFNFILAKERIAEKGKSAGQSFKDTIAYYPDLRSAVGRYLKEIALEKIAGNFSLMDYVSEYEDITERAVNEIATMVAKGRKNGNL